MKNIYAAIISYLLTAIILLATPTLLPAQQKTWSLQQCIRQALEKNIALKQNMLNNEINQINLTQSKANTLPNLNLADVQSANFGNNPNLVSYQSANWLNTSNNLGLSSTIILYNGFKNINLIKEYKLNYQSGNLDIDKMKNDLMLNVVAAYMQVLYQYEAVKIAQSQIDVTTEHLNYTEKYVKAGSLPESNFMQLQAQLATDKAAKINAENQLQLAKVILMQYMEIPVADGFEIEHPEIQEITPDVPNKAEDIYIIAEKLLPEIKSASIKTTASEYGLKIAKSEVKPKLTLTGSLATNYSSYNNLISYHTSSNITNIGYLGSNPAELVYGPVPATTTNNNYYPIPRQFLDNFGQGLSINLSVPIYNNLTYKSDIARSKVALNVAKLNENAVKNQLRKNTEQAYTDQLAASKNFIATKEQLTAEERAYHDITIKFKAGVINTTDFFVEKNNYNKAIIAHLQAKYDYIFKTKIVNFYLGNLITQ